jgi:CheY-like chemotaxis protein
MMTTVVMGPRFREDDTGGVAPLSLFMASPTFANVTTSAFIGQFISANIFGNSTVPDPQPQAFLSYTRLDNEFFGGEITALRKFLELGVKVVTGQRDFGIFQDIDGIEFGQQWQKILDRAISSARLLMPIVTPLFFSSPGCRDELEKFLTHEKALGRDDLILPIYYVTAPVLEKADLLANDPLATVISARQRYDWRAQADLPIDDPKTRAAVRDLAQKIAAAIARKQAPPGMESLAPKTLGIQRSLPQREESARESAFLNASVAIRNEQPEAQSKGAPKRILWVDDNPENNANERRAMAAYNIEFELARSTAEALSKLGHIHCDGIISDMARPGDPQAGYTLLDAVKNSANRPPFFIYAGSGARQHAAEALSRGAAASTNDFSELISSVITALGVQR